MLYETKLDKLIGEIVLANDQAKKAAHVSSGKLSASGLGEPLQWQILKTLGIGERVVDEYTLRKFLRGQQIEEWLITHMDGLVKKQEPVTYRNVVGFMDALVDTANYDFPVGVIPHEVKSVTNAKFKRLVKQKEADIGHKLQAGLYALALEAKHYAVDYVASDDLRVMTFVYPTHEIKPAIDQIIDEYDAQLAKKQVPVFSPRQKWQAEPLYNKFPEWSELTQKEIDMVIKVHYPTIWEKYEKN